MVVLDVESIVTRISVYKVTDGHFVMFLCIICTQTTIPEVTCIVNGNPVIPSLDLLAVGDGINHVSGCFSDDQRPRL